ncbi:hypothetical protein TNIN_98311 [Trichonephila inaurata madagascariensis]|uniref:Uncharacterized protein n=1 Tax=Trichonephila inaurata madagascariensis TaxID=2747483 RepID=A0A8X6XQH8_9ARAC|nr:hypothetical protein TNIN_98311 [Trichonephila inaurata madagascariensis]
MESEKAKRTALRTAQNCVVDDKEKFTLHATDFVEVELFGEFASEVFLTFESQKTTRDFGILGLRKSVSVDSELPKAEASLEPVATILAI